MAAIFEKFAKSWHIYFFTLGVENFDEIALSLTVKEIEAILCFATFGKKFENSKWPPFLKKISKVSLVYSFDTLNGIKNFDEIALSPTVKDIEAILCFRTFLKKSKIQNGCHFLKDKFFSKNTLVPRYPRGRKFRRNGSISHR